MASTPVASTSKPAGSAASPVDYATASREDLLARIAQLESRKATRSPSPNRKPKASPKTMAIVVKKQARASNDADLDFFDRYPTRKIALKFSYEGWPYCGLALQTEKTPLPTVEEVLLDALVRARLIRASQKRDVEGLDFSRCGRTDRGVSAAGQVVSLWVRSQLREQEGAKEPAWKPPIQPPDKPTRAMEQDVNAAGLSSNELNDLKQKKAARENAKEELPYMRLINGSLPASIRILAWSPVAEDFDARFSCASRHYKYFFSSSPTAPLNIDAMRQAAANLIGEHDFRNLCKVDPTKQIVNFRRRIMSATISPLGDENAGMGQQWVFDLEGTAFLYHQVRHIMAVLFLVGSGKEGPGIVNALVNTGYPDEDAEAMETQPDPSLPVIASKPSYEMADDLPLVLWDCRFSVSSVRWKQDATEEARFKAYRDMETHATELDLKSTISQHFLRAYRAHNNEAGSVPSSSHLPKAIVQVGAGRTIGAGKYTALLQRPRSDLVEVINQRWADGQGKRRAERKDATLHAGEDAEEPL